MQREPENKYFDRKSAQIRVADLAPLISAFANADGGTIVIGISDKKRILEGISAAGDIKRNDFINAPKNCCKPMPRYQYEEIAIENEEGKQDHLLLLHIAASVDQVIRTTSDETYLRIGDRTVEMLGDNLRNLEYAKNTRHYEDEVNIDAKISDLDPDLIAAYKEHVGASDLDTAQVLRARGFIKEQGGREYLTNAAVLLFAENVQQFYPNCRIRFVRYDGNFAKVGTQINIIRDTNIELPLLRIIDKAKDFIATQLREFTALNEKTGKFQIVPEYPEFAWLEGVVNAVTHREYGMTGSFIKVSMYDDRLEIESPGKLPDLVTVENIRETRYSRNPRISRVMTEFGWVRELNEGVKRIYSDMENFFLDAPEYSEPGQGVKLVLKNNIVMRRMRQENRATDSIGREAWEKLDPLEKRILTYMMERKSVNRAELAKLTGKSNATVVKRLNHLIELKLIKSSGEQFDPKRSYEITI